ncbi:hypothetical protein AUJ14_02140 [Candidatus Micrarchaeota archaeon CG1_02_55_22]|nr:MAG: hypothetical protein AUJ14_02140 [Candidatus Micrarchaeota archaeon CG1_02_55_22]
MLKIPDCVVVGGSFSGSVTAKHLAGKGVGVTVLEEHSLPGKFHKCSGIFSKKGLAATGVDYTNTVLNEVRGAVFHSGGRTARVERSETVALVCNRQALDEQAAKEAREAGAAFDFNRHVSSLGQSVDAVHVTASGNDYSSRVLVGCDGAQSAVARSAGFPVMRPQDFVLAFEAEYSGCASLDRRLVEVFFEPCFKGFFGWVIPVNEETARIGFATSDYASLQNVKQEFFGFPRITEMLGKKCVNCREFSHLIPVRVREKTQLGRVLLVGDAAGQVKATTGGGIVFNSQAARIAAKSIKQFLDGGELDYETAWRKELGKPLAAHRALRKLYNALPSAVFPPALAVSSALGLTGLVSRFGDMDYVVV